MSYSNAALVRRRRRRERIVLIIVLCLVVVFGFLEGWFFQYRSELPIFGNILLFALINLNVILLLLLVYLVLRNVVKLIFERRRRILGHRLRTRLTLAFVGLTLIPTLPLFGLATQFISFSLEYWFSNQVEQSLEQAVLLGKDYLKQVHGDLLVDAQLVQWELFPGGWTAHGPAVREGDVPQSFWERYHVQGAFVADAQGKVLWEVWKDPTQQLDPLVMAQLVREWALSDETVDSFPLVPTGGKREAMVAFRPVGGDEGKAPEAYLALVRTLPSSMAARLDAVVRGYENYSQLKLLKAPLKTSHLITFSIATLLVLFAAVWFGLYLARDITGPIQGLLMATEKVAEGDLDVSLDWERDDEIGTLLASFNRMVRDLRHNREQLTLANEALQESNRELEDRRRYMEIVLRNIGAGVVSVDVHGTIRTMNKAAEEMLGLQGDGVIGRSYTELLQAEHLQVVKAFRDMYQVGRQPTMERHAQVMVGNRLMALLIKVSLLRDEEGRDVGVVVVLDDLSELQKAQRMAAWREVARRIAHEIKNPLTPIKLSAQRIRRKYGPMLDEEGGVLAECTQTIIEQVDHMKRLVDEFSSFARMPDANPTPCDLGALVEEAVALYRHTYPKIQFVVDRSPDFPLLRLDRGQFRQVLNNLLENAVQALDGASGRIELRLYYDSILRIARLECADTGRGLPPEARLRMFEPYYSTKEKGSGLGLAIVSKIITDHNGFVRVRDNEPRGTVIVIELPGT
ncbi:two-component system, NtrC family, nitrogen regulation sensor histidine kinase NtrY [Desulfacinum hydrothermale DSM 13146]|uniref:histidine kinase n=1 Tax=Desulfacinum hydrothermale DSM 13146 TaxID=1121390 RepID=A0A1W1XGU8_9BACT|nr:ATP-binding protein [Desulfacinum hydrothermale]SMC22748.1 two-component system, NtrC family, nitrogen regulation sensor histidine kinase NtrY [Desulfacinum hydrothermale DSM 13146]